MKLDQVAVNAVSTKLGTFEQTLAAYAEAGFRKVEFPMSKPRAWLEDGHDIDDLRRLLRDHGLSCIGGFQAPITCFAEGDARAANHDLLLRNAELIADLGGTTMVAGTDGPPQPMGPAALDHVAEVVAAFADRLPGSVRIGLEFNWSPVVRSLRSADHVVRRANHPRVGILFDPAHYHCTPSKLEDLTDEVVARIALVHVNDMRPVPGEHADCNADRVLPGQGCLPLPALIERIEAGGYRGDFSIEMFNEDLWAMPPIEAAKAMYVSMRGLVVSD